MRAVGVIAEYNPLHTGHEYHLRRARELSGADYVIAVMSPDFVQRGEPAVFDKYTRTRMALRCGADLVLELPVSYATGSAEYFAQGAVAILAGTGIADTICFGAECSRQNASAAFLEAARLLNGETPEFQEALRAHLGAGATFPQARACALKETGQEKTAELLSSPNNLLGVEYCRALLKLHSGIRPIPVKRLGAAYGDTELVGPYCSASALRKQIHGVQNSGLRLQCVDIPVSDAGHSALPGQDLLGENFSDGISDISDSSPDCSVLRQPEYFSEKSSDEISDVSDPAPDRFALRTWGGALGAARPYIPRDCFPLFYQACKTAIFPDSLLPALRYRLLSPESFDDIFGLTPALAARLTARRFSCMDKTFAETTELLKTRQITEAAVRRALLHLILGIRNSETEKSRAAGIAHYARILGFRREAAPLLHAIRKNGSLPLIARPSAAGRMLTDTGKRLWERDLFASHYYESLRGGAFRTEYEQSPIISG